MTTGRWLMSLVICVAGCGDSGTPSTVVEDGVGDAATDVAELDAGADPLHEVDEEPVGPVFVDFELLVTLDGEPAPDVVVMQGGEPARWHTEDDGTLRLRLRLDVEGLPTLIASHPAARIRPVEIWDDEQTSATIELTSYDPTDNPEYIFQDPGEPERRKTTSQCGHCHNTLNDDWVESAHRRSASNPTVLDVYAGTAALEQAECEAAGGSWETGPVPGSDDESARCVAAAAARDTADHGECASCHAPGIDGAVGGRDLLEARDHAFEYGVHCDVCHRVAAVDLDLDAPGVAGRLQLVRPSEPSPSISLGVWFPITFGPNHDSPNPRMGSVQRDHFHDGTLCAGCHEQRQPVLVEGAEIDLARWPDGRLPIHSTWSEWEAGPMAPAAACPTCHMPSAPGAENSADLHIFTAAQIGVQAGWPRAPGSVRHHSWAGPRDKTPKMLELAAALNISVESAGGEVTAAVTVRNAGPGHAIPTGEPMRHLVLLVEARCGDEVLDAVGGDAVPGWAGWLDRREAGEDWSVWPGAAEGDVVWVVSHPEAHHDYVGYGPFGDGTFDAAAKGLPVEEIAGSATITSVAGETVTFDRDLPEGYVAYRVDEGGLPGKKSTTAWAGRPGFAFARVTRGANGEAMVPHFLAVDVSSDNRLLPGHTWTTQHLFAGDCAEPIVEAVLMHRAYPLELARERGWELRDRLMTRAVAGGPAQDAMSLDVVPAGDSPTVVALELTAAPATFEIGHETVEGYAYNGQVPGPTIRATVGDTLQVDLTNALDVPTTIHWHGVHVPWDMDGVVWMQDPVAPGETFRYTFELTTTGTFWYHPHFDTAGQVDLGLYGVLVVEAPDEPAVDEDVVLVFDSWGEHAVDEGGHAEEHGEHDHGAALPSAGWTIGGEDHPDLSFAGGSRVRARLVNVSNSGYLALSWPGMRLIAGDQGLRPVTEEPELIVLAPGDRAEVMWLVGEEGFTVMNTPWSVAGPTWLEPAPLFEVAVHEPAAAPEPLTWPSRGPAEPSGDPGYTDIVYTLSGSDEGGAWLINGEEFPDVTVRSVPLGQDTVIEVRNLSPTRHPWHLHGHAFEVLSIDGVTPGVRMVEDTIDVPIHGRVRVRLIADNPGDWMAHCHILPHADRGMMTVLRVE